MKYNTYSETQKNSSLKTLHVLEYSGRKDDSCTVEAKLKLLLSDNGGYYRVSPPQSLPVGLIMQWVLYP